MSCRVARLQVTVDYIPQSGTKNLATVFIHIKNKTWAIGQLYLFLNMFASVTLRIRFFPDNLGQGPTRDPVPGRQNPR